MAYTELGEWQALVGTIRTVDEAAVTIDIRLGGYTARPNTLHVDLMKKAIWDARRRLLHADL